MFDKSSPATGDFWPEKKGPFPSKIMALIYYSGDLLRFKLVCVKMVQEVAPCMLDASRKVKKLRVCGTEIGISRLDLIILEVSELGLEDEDDIKAALLERIKEHNYVPSGAEKDYVDAVFEEYIRRMVTV